MLLPHSRKRLRMNATSLEESIPGPPEAHRVLAPSEDIEMSEKQGLDKHPDTPTHPPNLLALAILQTVRERQQGRKPTDSSRTQEYLREARSGKMYGDGDNANH
jgi:hypothetical protein